MNTRRNALFAAVVVLLITACSQPAEDTSAIQSAPPAATPAPAEPAKPFPPSFDGTVSLSARLEDGQKPAVVGVTNLPDGTELMVTLSRKKSSFSGQDKATVSNGAFRAGPFSQQGVDLNPGEYVIDIGSPLAALQPASVQAAFGDTGANLKGPLTGPSPIGGTVVNYSTKVKIGGQSNVVLDAAAQRKAKSDLHQWYINACDDRCRIVSGVAAKQGKQFDRDACYQQCLAEIPGQ